MDVLLRVVDAILQAWDRVLDRMESGWPDNRLQFYAKTICAMERSVPPHGDPRLCTAMGKYEHWQIMDHNVHIRKMRVGYKIHVGHGWTCRVFWTRHGAVKYLATCFRQWSTEWLTESGEHQSMASVLERVPRRVE